MATWRIHSVSIYGDGMGAAVIMPGIISQALESDNDLQAEVEAGSVHPKHVALNGRKLIHRLSTYNVGTLLAAISPDGLAIESSVNTGVIAYLQKYDDYGQAVSGSNHRSYQYMRGVIYPTRLRIDHQSDARLDAEMKIIKSGANGIVTISASAALPTISVASKRYTLGPITIANSSVSNYTGLDITFGNRVETEGVESNVDDTLIGQLSSGHRITITGLDPEWLETTLASLDGRSAAHATDSIYLKAREAASGDHFYEDGDTDHGKFTLYGLGCVGGAFDAQASRISETTLEIVTAEDTSGNAPLIFSDEVAIT
jgi:hypothetical protein